MVKNGKKLGSASWVTMSMALLASLSAGALSQVAAEELATDTYAVTDSNYTVQAGDGLYRIAINHGMSLEELKALNGLSSNFIYPGQVLRVSTGNAPVETTDQEETNVTEETTNNSFEQSESVQLSEAQTLQPLTQRQNNGTYTVKAGEWVNKIAQDHGITADQLRQWNNLKSDLIHPGQVLVVSQGSTTPTQPKPSQPKPSQPGSSTQPSKTYTVKAGEWVNKIAQDHGITADQLRQWNNLKSDLIHPGQVLVVSQGSTVPTQPKPSQPGSSTQPSKTYTVKAGEWVNKIAQDHGITADQLRQWNNLKSDLIHPGQVLVVSQGSTVPTQPKPAQPKPSQPGSNTQPSKTYTVKAGEWVNKIAQDHGITADQLRQWNNLKSDLIHPGQVLVVSQGTTTPTQPKPVQPKPSQPGTSTQPSKTYTVKAGEWVNKIAQDHGITADQLRQWNNLKSDLIHPGQVLIVSPGTNNTPSQPKPAQPSPSQPSGSYVGTNLSRVNYGVQAGDTLYTIAKNFGVTPEAIRQANGGLSRLYVGQTIIIPNVQVVPMSHSRSFDGKRVVWLDAGHGGNDSGTHTVSGRIYEKDMNLNLDNQLTRILEDMGYIVRRTRTDDSSYDFRTERSRMVNGSDADIFISLHHNAMPTPSATGIVSFYYEYEDGYKPVINGSLHNDGMRIANSAHLTNLIHNNLISTDHRFFPNNPARNHGVQSASYAVLRETKVPAALLEFGFVDTWNDFNKLVDKNYQNQIMHAVARGIDTYFNTVFSKK
ncbi:LysM peptidoglycan-binding domain-containing protein [Ignavigranum ruoffiae]